MTAQSKKPQAMCRVSPPRGSVVLLIVCVLFGAGRYAVAAEPEDAGAVIRQAVQTELVADREDRSRWRYRDDQQDKGTVSIVVQTDAGTVKRLIARSGKPISAGEAATVQQNLEDFIHDPAKLAKQRRDGESDDKSATELLRIMPEAFDWKIVSRAGTEDILAFSPRASFRPPDMEARVLGAMSGEVAIDKGQHRISTLRGRLTQDVMIGFGVLGRLKAGGTFRVERREIKPGIWQVTETHVHIDGKALLFKTIGQQQDEVQTEWTEVPGGTTLEQAVEMSKTLH